MAELNNTSSGQWSEVDASNTSASPDGWPSGTFPNQVEPIGRSTMGAIKRFWDRINGTITTTGSSNAYIYTPTNVSFPTAYVKGEEYTFQANFANTGASTLNINGLGAKNLFKKSATGAIALVGGEIQALDMVKVQYDGTQLQIMSDVPFAGTGTVNNGSINQLAYYAANGTAVSGLTTANNAYLRTGASGVPSLAAAPSIASQVFSSSGTFTTPANTTSATIFKCTIIGGGGGGGGNDASSFGSGGGGAGATAIYYASSLTASTGYAMTVGGGGAGGIGANNGSTGSASTAVFGATTITANGGAGGIHIAGNSSAGGGAGGTATNGTINITGGAGGFAIGQSLSAPEEAGGKGGDSTFGGGALSPTNGAPANGNNAAANSGGGGSGSTGAGTATGGAGGSGIILIEWIL